MFVVNKDRLKIDPSLKDNFDLIFYIGIFRFVKAEFYG